MSHTLKCNAQGPKLRGRTYTFSINFRTYQPVDRTYQPVDRTYQPVDPFALDRPCQTGTRLKMCTAKTKESAAKSMGMC